MSKIDVNKVIILLVTLLLSSCGTYTSMPPEWERQVLSISNCDIFSGKYEITKKSNFNSKNEKYNDLRYLINSRIYGEKKGRANSSKLTSINIKATKANVNIEFLSKQKIDIRNSYNEESFECINNTLTLNLTNHWVNDGGASLYYSPKIIMYKSRNNHIYVKREDAATGLVFLIPASTHDVHWFELSPI